MKDIGNKIKSKRKAIGMTQQELCNKAGISVPTLISMEKGSLKNLTTYESVLQLLGYGITHIIIDPEDESGNEVIDHTKNR